MANTNKELFEQAIAEAKYVREAAISNAKESLEESMTPYLRDLLAAKLQEMEEEETEEELLEEKEETKEAKKSEKEEASEAEEKEDDKEEEDDSEKSDDDSEEVESEEDMPDMPDLEDVEAEESEEEVSLEDMEISDLRELIRDLIQQEMGEAGPAEDEIDLDSEPMPADDVESDMVARDDEDISLEELLRELDLSEEEDEPASEEMYESESNLKKELEEALATIESLKSELSEINLLNTKLLYLNKAFNNHTLSESQKADLISTFDKAETKKEIELVYETFSTSVRKQKEQIKEAKGYASKPVGQAAKKEIISEVDESVRRMQKLAGII